MVHWLCGRLVTRRLGFETRTIPNFSLKQNAENYYGVLPMSLSIDPFINFRPNVFNILF